MTPFVPITDGAQAELLFSYGGETVENRLWFVNRTPPTTTTQLQDLADGLAAWHVAQVLPYLSSSLLLGIVLVRDWSGTSPGLPILSVVNLSGGVSGASCSANVADRVWFKSSTLPRDLWNSNFICGLPDAAVNLNTVDTTFRTNIRDAYINLIDLAPVFGPFPAWRWVCASAWDAGTLRTEQLVRRTDFIRYRKPYVSQRRKRLPV